MKTEALKPAGSDDERSPAANDNERGYDTYKYLSERVAKLVQAAQEGVQEFPEVEVRGEMVSFSLERDADLLKLAEAQQLLGALKQFAEGLRDSELQYGVPLTSEQLREQQGTALLIGSVKGHIQVLEARADAVSEARRRPEAIRLVEAADMIAKELTPPPYANDTEQPHDVEQIRR